MPSFRIDGGASLRGVVHVDGAKNAALPACCAALLVDQPVVLHRVPQLRDVSTILYMLSALGKRVVRNEENVSIASSGALNYEANAYSVRQMRASFLVLGPLVARLGRARVPLPGGCVIGARPVDLHLEGLRALGATVEERPGYVEVRADRLHGARIAMRFPSVGATEQLLMTACLARGNSMIENAAIEPEIDDLVALLRAMGAEIEREGRTYRIAGRPSLHGAQHELLPDRLEAGTLLLAAAITQGDVRVAPAVQEHMTSLLDFLGDAGAEIIVTSDGIRCRADAPLEAASLRTAPFPGFPTDLHPPVAALLALAKGASTIEETVFEKRFAYVGELGKMGARMVHDGALLSIQGASSLVGAQVEAPDLRGGAALVLAGLAAEGSTMVGGVKHVDRGYAALEEKLQTLGASIERRETSTD